MIKRCIAAQPTCKGLEHSRALSENERGHVFLFAPLGFQNQYGHCDEITKFLEHATLLKGVDHPNVQSFLHLSVEDNYVPIVAYPIMEYGNLQQFLALCRMAPSDSPLNVSHVIIM